MRKDKLIAENKGLTKEIEKLGKFILENCEGYPKKDESACECAITIITELKESKVVPEEPTEEKEESDFINSEAKLAEIGFKHSTQSTANFTEYHKTVDGVLWAFVTRTAGNDYLMKDGEFVCHCENWILLNDALNLHKLKD